MCFQYPLVVLMLITGEIYQLINFASFSRWFFIALATLGMLIHRYRFPDHPRPFKVNTLLLRLSFILNCKADSFDFYLITHPIGAIGHCDHLHSGLLLHRGFLTLFGPLEHRTKLCPHADWAAGILCDHKPLSAAPQVEAHFQ